MNSDKNSKIEQILNSLDASQRASAPDFFYTRLKARMQRESEGGNKSNKAWILRPVYVLAALIVVLIMNIAVIFKNDPATATNNTDGETVQSIAAEYSLNDNTTMDVLTMDK